MIYHFNHPRRGVMMRLAVTNKQTMKYAISLLFALLSSCAALKPPPVPQVPPAQAEQWLGRIGIHNATCTQTTYRESRGLFAPGQYVVFSKRHGLMLVRSRSQYHPNQLPFVVSQAYSIGAVQVPDMGFIERDAIIFRYVSK